jgi:phage baseplate assembly protein W
MTTTPKFRDFNINFRSHPVTGDLSIVSDEKSVNQSIKNLIFMNFYDVPFEPKIGSNVRARLFDLITSTTSDTIRNDIKDVIENFEPRVEIIDISVEDFPLENSIAVSIRYRLRTSTNDITLSFFLERII